MTSTPFSLGLSGERRSSRVLQPPGGGHTNIFSNEPETVRGRRLLTPTSSDNLHVGGDSQNTINGGKVNGKIEKVVEEPSPAPEPEAKAPEAKAPEPQHETASGVQKSQAPASQIPQDNRRGRVPPGGFSTPLW